MKKHTFLFAGILFLFVLGVTGLAAAQDSPRKDDGGARVQGRAGDHSFDVQVQGGESRREDRHVNLQRSTTADRDRRGGKENPDLKVRQDPQVRPAERYWAWIPPWRYSSGWLFFAVVIVGIVAASRGRE